ncbi:MAG: UbiX family flavin prenyltransferase [Rickettsia sp.]|nr:UbiX family flavin prenyltransferase [Rickettsia sp.]
MLKRVVVCISGASGTIYAIRLLKILKSLKSKYNLESHLVISKFAAINIKLETKFSLDQVIELADVYHANKNLGAIIASGSFLFDSVIVIPCSMKTLSAISNGYEENLISRVSHVAIKEKRPLLLAIRETPLNSIHIKNMLILSNIGAFICPLVSNFYNNPQNIQEMIDYSIYRMLDLLDIREEDLNRWQGIKNHLSLNE